MADRPEITIDTTSADKRDTQQTSPPLSSPVESIEDPEVEATELSVRKPSPTHSPEQHKRPSGLSTVQEAPPPEQSLRASTRDSRLSDTSGPLKRFWLRQVSVRVPHDACRDHLGS